MAVRQLAYRETDAGRVKVDLSWDEDTSHVLLSTVDTLMGEVWQVVVPREHAMDAFNHPFAWVGGNVA